MLQYLCVLILIFGFSLIAIETAWVEIPQITNEKSPFVLGSPKLEKVSNLPTTTPSNYKILMTTTHPPVGILTTTFSSFRMNNSKSNATITKIRKSPNRRIDKEINEVKSDENNNINETSNYYSGFLPLLNNIQETLQVNTKKSLKSKISLLRNLRDNLLVNINERMASLWNPTEALPEARGHHDEHEMDFPSNEGALMTIAFLTFAVFLIKLVLKLIQALKNKTTANAMMNVNGMNGMTAMGGMATGTTYIGRKKRYLDDYDTIQILQLIDEYKFN